MKENKLLGLREKIFLIIGMFLINVFLVVKFIIHLVHSSTLITLVEEEARQEGVSISGVYGISKVCCIVMVSIAILLILVAYLPILIRNKNINLGIVLSTFTVTMLCFLIMLVLGIYVEKYFSIRGLYDSSFSYQVFVNTYGFNFLFLSAILILSNVVCLISCNISNTIYLKKETEDSDKKVKDVDDAENKEIPTDVTAEEKVLKEKIEELKANLKIKNLEKEYLSLKSQLDEK